MVSEQITKLLREEYNKSKSQEEVGKKFNIPLSPPFLHSNQDFSKPFELPSCMSSCMSFKKTKTAG